MSKASIAGIQFCDRVMRYAEVEHDESRFRLVRLGNCEFEFDVAAVAYEGGTEAEYETISDGIADVFAESDASVVRYVIPSAYTTRFTSVVSREMDIHQRSAQIGFETRMFNGGVEGGDVFPSHLRAPDETDVDVFAVSHVDRDLTRRLAELAEPLSGLKVEMDPASMASTLAFRHMAHREQLSPGAYLIVGADDGWVDITLMQNAEPRTQVSIHAPYAEDAAYHALATCSRFGYSSFDVAAVLLHGDREELESAMEGAFGERVYWMNPGIIVDLARDRLDASFRIESFVGVLGAAVR